MKRCPICAREFPEAARSCPKHKLPLVEPRIDIAPQSESSLTGSVVDERYLLGHLAGQGGMGAVYEAENLRIGRRVALKVIHQDLHADPKMRVRLFREVQATSRIHHPNVVEIYDYGEDPQLGAYLVMEFLEGQSLGAVLRERGRLPVDFILRVITQLLSALAATHATGLIHRDIKPSNIRILPNGVAKVLDFGLVKAFEHKHGDEFSTITTGGIAFGTPWYMSPEQASFTALDPRSDIYSLGIVLYELLAGRPPFVANNAVDLIEAQRHKQPPLFSQLDEPVTVPAPLELLVMKMLKKPLDERHQSVSEVMDHLYLVSESLGIDLADTHGEAPREAPVVQSTIPTIPIPTQPVYTDDDRPTEGMTTPFWPPEDPTVDMGKAIRARVDELAEHAVKHLQRAIPRYRTQEPQALIGQVRKVMGIALDIVIGGGFDELPEPIKKLADERSEQAFSVTELLGAFLLAISECRSLLATGPYDLATFAEMQRQMDRRIIPMLLKLVEHYFSRFNQRLIKLNDVLRRRNDELGQLRGDLAVRLKSTTSQLADLERLKARVVDNISSGLVLVERGTHNILMYNKAMEQLSGVSAAEVLHRPLEDVMHFVDGLPYHEFLEQLRMHGEVGLRKLRLVFASGERCSVYLRGQTFPGADRQAAATLFVLDDVTERERIISNFSRYVSRAVVDKVLQRRGEIQPSGELRQVVILACGLRDFQTHLREMSPAEATDLLTEYISIVGDAIFPCGGLIESVQGATVLAYFPINGEKACDPIVMAAASLCRALDSMINTRMVEGKEPLVAGIGLHLGDVLVLNVGSEKRMVQTIVGEAADIAQRLQQIAAGCEILLSEDVTKRCSQKLDLRGGPALSMNAQDKPLFVNRLLCCDTHEA
ncbi:MAG: protein kinase [Deltaproteobacteria bacterium]|nr:protein kinase [Deltaproteobacteria bacterium]